MNRQENSMTRQQFEMEYALHQAVKRPFPESLESSMNALRLNSERLAEKLGASTDTVKRYMSGKNLPPRPMAVALCIALALKYEQSVSFLKSMGIALSTNRKEEYAYEKLLKRYSGKPIPECNQFLEEMAIEKKYRLYPRNSKKS